MKLRLTSRIVLSFVLLAAALLVTVGVLSARNVSKRLMEAAISETLVTAIEKEAALDNWIEGHLDGVTQIASESDLVEKAANLLAAALGSAEAR